MKNIKWYESVDVYNASKHKMIDGQISYTFDTKQNWFKENYILAKYIISNTSSIGSVGSLNTLSESGTNVVGGRENYSRLISAQTPTSFDITTLTNYHPNSKVSTLSDTSTISMSSLNYSEETIDGAIYSCSFCAGMPCLTYYDDSIYLDKKISSLKIVAPSDDGYRLVLFYKDINNEIDYTSYCDFCLDEWLIDEYFLEEIDNNFSDYLTYENNTFTATEKLINNLNQYIEEFPNVFGLYSLSKDEFVDYQIIIDDNYVINTTYKPLNFYGLQILDSYDTEVLKYISEIYINGVKQSEVLPYYELHHYSNEFDVKIVFNTKNIDSLSHMFQYCDALYSVDFEQFNLQNGVLKDTSYMFRSCTNLVELLNIDKFDTSGVNYMISMFSDCYSLGCYGVTLGDGSSNGRPESLSTYGVNQSTQTNIVCENKTVSVINDTIYNENHETNFIPTHSSFINIIECNSNLKLTFTDTFDFKQDMVMCVLNYDEYYGTDNESVIDTTNMTYGYIPLSAFTKVSNTEVIVNKDVISHINNNLYYSGTHNCITFICVNYECMNSNPQPTNSIDFPTIDPSCVYDVKMTTECLSPSIFDLSKLNVSSVKNMSYMFQYCTNTNYFDFSTWNTSNVTNIEQMFYSCDSLISLDLSNWDLSNILEGYMNDFISNCYSLEYLDFTCKSNYTSITSHLVNIKTGGTIVFKSENMYIIPGALTYSLSELFNWNYVFYKENIELAILDNGNEITNGDVLCNDTPMIYNSEKGVWVYENYNLNENTIKPIITYNSVNYEINFGQRYILVGDNSSYNKFHVVETINVDESEIGNDVNLFYVEYSHCVLGMYIDNVKVEPTSTYAFSSAGTHTVKFLIDLQSMMTSNSLFYDCYGLTSIDLTYLDTSNVTDMGYMFENCYNLTSITFGDKFDTSNVTDMRYMFYGCTSLTSLDLSNFDLTNVTDMSCMFEGCDSLDDNTPIGDTTISDSRFECGDL